MKTINPLMDALKLQSTESNGPLYSNMATGRLSTDWWAVTLGTVRRGLNGLRPHPVPSSVLAVPNVTAHPSTASVPTSHYSMWHYNYLSTIKG